MLDIMHCPICQTERRPNINQCSVCGCIFGAQQIVIDRAQQLSDRIGRLLGQSLILVVITYQMGKLGWQLAQFLYESRQSKWLGLIIFGSVSFGLLWEAIGEIENYRYKSFREILDDGGIILGLIIKVILLVCNSISWVCYRVLKLFNV